MNQEIDIPFNASFQFDPVRGVAVLNWEIPTKDIALLLKILGNISFTSRDVVTLLRKQLRDLGTAKETADLIKQLLSKYGSLSHLRL